MNEDFFTKEILESYILSLKKMHDPVVHAKKLKYIIDWLDWLQYKGLISKQDYDESISKLKRERIVEIHGHRSIFLYTFLKNHSWKLLIAIGIFFIGILVIFYSKNRGDNSTERMKYDNYDSSTLHYRGRLLDQKGLPITSKTDIAFRIYESPVLGEKVYEGFCKGEKGITPDYNGNFTVVLGSDCSMSPLPDGIFENRKELYLGVQMGRNLELVPRQKIFTSAYSSDAARLQGLQIGTEKGSIPFINKDGKVILSETNPVLETGSGIFTIESPEIAIKTNGKEAASIIFQPASNGNTIVSSGKFLVGTHTPVSVLTAQATEPYGTVGTFKNIAPDDDENLSVLNLHLSTPISGTQSSFIQFYAGSSEEGDAKKVGGIRLNNEGVVYESAGADFAEYFEVYNYNIEAGNIMTLAKEGIHKGRKGEIVIGVVSDSAGFVGNKKDKNKNNILIGLVGQLDVFVSNINGDIKVGDGVEVSSIEGFGQKAVGDQIVGYALENMTDRPSISCPQNVKSDYSSNIICSKIKLLIK